MCGIAVFFSRSADAPPVDAEALNRCVQRMASRGPDGAGSWFSPDGRVALGHRRLSILDLSDAGSQPMALPDGSLHIVFNGEIYNFRELQSELRKQGVVFRSNSDTEVLLHLYSKEGHAMLSKLRGMFAFAIWDAERHEMFLARDPHGIKPLYFADDGQTFRAASQVKSLLAAGRVDTTPDPAGHVGFFLMSYVPEPYTLYKGIRCLPAGTSLKVSARGVQARKYWDLSEIYREAIPSNSSPALGDLIGDSVRAHLVSDVPVGVFLSAGIDSNAIAAHASAADGNLRSLTLSFAEYEGTEFDEAPLAEATAQRLGLRHSTVSIDRKHFDDGLEHLLDQMDQPTTDGPNVYFVSWAAHQAGIKVALSGLGGDELFGGYRSFTDVPNLARSLGWSRYLPFLGGVFRELSRPIFGRLTSPKYASLMDYGGSIGGAYFLRRALFMPWELADFMDQEMAGLGLLQLGIPAVFDAEVTGLSSGNAPLSCLESIYYMRNQLLRDADWAGMAHSLEIRLPLVDRNLSASLAPHVKSTRPPSKFDLLSSSPETLASKITKRRKTGFYVPINRWVAESLGIQERGLRGWAKAVYRQFLT